MSDFSTLLAGRRGLVSFDDVGAMALGLVSDLAMNASGNIAHVDGGYHVMS